MASKKTTNRKCKYLHEKKNGAIKKYEEEHFVDSTKPVWNYSLFTEEDIGNFQEWHSL